MLSPFRAVTRLSARKELLTFRRAKSKSFLMASAHELITVLRYDRVDYAFASAAADDVEAGITDIVVTYDVTCQWEKYLAQRLASYTFARSLDIRALNSFRPAIPKFHVYGHALLCQTLFNLAYMDGVGMTHGESVETIWSHSGPVAISSRENGPGARHLILDDHWNGWNWRKYVGLRKSSAP